MGGKMLEQDAVREIENVALSNNTINRYIVDIVLCHKLKNNSFFIHFEGSTDFTKKIDVDSICNICKWS
jgi:hypothetical protein